MHRRAAEAAHAATATAEMCAATTAADVDATAHAARFRAMRTRDSDDRGARDRQNANTDPRHGLLPGCRLPHPRAAPPAPAFLAWLRMASRLTLSHPLRRCGCARSTVVSHVAHG